ncbi:taurine ABC transporter substrate-binding protein, partial [Pelagibacterales bacterium SAG-MED43]|nr:taurine ABC transporter substrate-binding protein [Pelagibacterales bacterium SAG-MED43]
MRKIFALLILTLLINTNAISKDLRVAYFLEWPTPNLEDKGLGVFDRELGARVYWKNFSTGGDMF